MLKISAFYLDKQKSFIPKKKLGVPCTMNSSYFSQKMATRRPNFPHSRLWNIASQEKYLKPQNFYLGGLDGKEGSIKQSCGQFLFQPNFSVSVSKRIWFRSYTC